MQDHELKYNREPVCPYCGTKEIDAWELHLDGDGDKTEMSCGHCDETYVVELNLTVEYSTAKVSN